MCVSYTLRQAGLVPLQGFLNAAAYGWIRGDFLSVMSTQHNLSNLSDSQPHSVNRTDVRRDAEDDEDDDSELSADTKREGGLVEKRPDHYT